MLRPRRPNTKHQYKPTKHEREMEMLRAYSQFLLTDRAARQECLVGSGIFVRAGNGEIAVAEPYKMLFTGIREM